MLVADSDISINIDDPPTMKNRDNSSIFSSFQYQPVPNKAIESAVDPMVSPDKTGGNQVGPAPAGSGKKLAPDISIDESKSMLLNSQQVNNSSKLDVLITP